MRAGQGVGVVVVSSWGGHTTPLSALIQICFVSPLHTSDGDLVSVDCALHWLQTFWARGGRRHNAGSQVQVICHHGNAQAAKVSCLNKVSLYLSSPGSSLRLKWTPTSWLWQSGTETLPLILVHDGICSSEWRVEFSLFAVHLNLSTHNISFKNKTPFWSKTFAVLVYFVCMQSSGKRSDPFRCKQQQMLLLHLQRLLPPHFLLQLSLQTQLGLFSPKLVWNRPDLLFSSILSTRQK